MNNKNFVKGAVLIIILVLPFLIYFIFVYGSEETFFVKLDYVGPKTYTEKTVNGETVLDSGFYTVPDFGFVSQNDTTVSAQDLRGKIYLVNFFFSSCPSICPAMNYNVQQIQERFKGYPDFRIVSITVDPEHDTVEVLQNYARKMKAIDGRWHFLTGETDSIYSVSQGFFASAMPDSNAEGGFLHSENLLLVDWAGHIRSGRDEQGNIKGVYNSLQPVEVKTLKEDIKTLIAEYEKKKSVDEYKMEKEKKRRENG